MAEKRNIVLCGFMATGKSSVGKKLAEYIGYKFVDLDAAIEAAEGISVAQIFASRGEAAFRELETAMVGQVAQQTELIIATGGGTIVDSRNLATLKSTGVVITLTADVATILRRAGSGSERPLLVAPDREERIRALLRQRAAAYAQADITLDTSRRTIDEVVDELLVRLSDFALAPD